MKAEYSGFLVSCSIQKSIHKSMLKRWDTFFLTFSFVLNIMILGTHNCKCILPGLSVVTQQRTVWRAGFSCFYSLMMPHQIRKMLSVFCKAETDVQVRIPCSLDSLLLHPKSLDLLKSNIEKEHVQSPEFLQGGRTFWLLHCVNPRMSKL